jgi:hypothetical protein
MPCIAILKEQKYHFFSKSENRRAEQFLSGGLVMVGEQDVGG